MATYQAKNWINRQVEYKSRRKLVPTGISDVYDVDRYEGLIFENGDAFNSENMNDLERRISQAFSGVSGDFGDLETTIINRVNTLDAQNVKLTGAQSISGIKTFSALPITSITPTSDNQLTRKGYVDSAISTAITNARTVVRSATIPNAGWSQSGSFYTRTTGISLPSGTNGNTIDLYIPRDYLSNLVSWVSVDNVGGTIYISSGAIPNGNILIYMTFNQTI